MRRPTARWSRRVGGSLSPHRASLGPGLAGRSAAHPRARGRPPASRGLRATRAACHPDGRSVPATSATRCSSCGLPARSVAFSLQGGGAIGRGRFSGREPAALSRPADAGSRRASKPLHRVTRSRPRCRRDRAAGGRPTGQGAPPHRGARIPVGTVVDEVDGRLIPRATRPGDYHEAGRALEFGPESSLRHGFRRCCTPAGPKSLRVRSSVG